MVYRFKLVSDEVSNFSREIEIDSEASFLDLRNIVLDSVGFSKDDMNSFYICDNDWTRHQEITLVDMGSSSDEDIWLMADTVISEFLEDEGQRLMFVFDYFTERAFFMELKETVPGKNIDGPRVTSSKGTPPAQSMEIEIFEQKVDQAAARHSQPDDLDMDFYGDSQFNEDELPEGFEEMSVN